MHTSAACMTHDSSHALHVLDAPPVYTYYACHGKHADSSSQYRLLSVSTESERNTMTRAGTCRVRLRGGGRDGPSPTPTPDDGDVDSENEEAMVRRATGTQTHLLDRMREMERRMQGSAQWKGVWLRTAGRDGDAPDGGWALGICKRIAGRWVRWVVIACSAHMRHNGKWGLGLYSWRSDAGSTREWVVGSFNGDVRAIARNEESATAAAAERAEAGNQYMMVFKRVSEYEDARELPTEAWGPGCVAPKCNGECTLPEASMMLPVHSIVCSRCGHVHQSSWWARTMREGRKAAAARRIVWDVVDGSTCGPPYVQEAVDHRCARGGEEEATARLRGGDRTLIAAPDITAYDNSCPARENARSELLWYYGASYPMGSMLPEHAEGDVRR